MTNLDFHANSQIKNIFRMEAIGIIESCYRDKFGTPRQSGLAKHSMAQLRLRPDLQAEQSLEGITGFSHLWLIWVFHQNHSQRFHAKVHPPRLQGKSMGLFATRTPHRPNPIGLSLVELVDFREGVLLLKGIDLIDGTPILDVKPYLPEVEALPEARSGWVETLPQLEFKVEFVPEVEKAILAMGHNLRELIIESICLDPRPRAYKDSKTGLSIHRDVHFIRLYNVDIQFRFCDNKSILVESIKLIKDGILS